MCGNGLGGAAYAALRQSATASGALNTYMSISGSGWAYSWTFNGVIPKNLWTHIALVRNDTTIVLYINGELINSQTIASSSRLMIGSITWIADDTTSSVPGNLFGFRVSKTARYTSAFTPVRGKFTSDNDTLLLTCQNAFLTDESPYRFEVVSNQDSYDESYARIQTLCDIENRNVGNSSLLSGQYLDANGKLRNNKRGTAYFNGSSTWISTPAAHSSYIIPSATTPLTVECVFFSARRRSTAQSCSLVCNQASSNNRIIFSMGWGAPATSGTNMSASTTNFYFGFFNGSVWNFASPAYAAALPTWCWVHAVGTFDGQYIRLYLNGRLVGATPCTAWVTDSTNTNGLIIGRRFDTNYTYPYFAGQISGIRAAHDLIYPPSFTAPSTPPAFNHATKVLSNFESGINMDSAVTSGLTWNTSYNTGAGSVALATDDFKFGTQSVKLLGGKCLITATSSELGIAKNDFQLEGWFKRIVTPTGDVVLFDTRASGSSSQQKFTIGVQTNGAVFAMYFNTKFVTTAANQFIENQWNHVVFKRRKMVFCFYINGVHTGDVKYLNDDFGTTGVLCVGNSSYDTTTVTNAFNGYVDGIRYMTCGTTNEDILPLPYDNKFTNTTNTFLNLNFDNNPVTEITGNAAIIARGDVKIDKLSVAGNETKCIKFSNNGFLLDNLGSMKHAIHYNNFTLEAWIYPTVAPTNGNPIQIIGLTSNSGYKIPQLFYVYNTSVSKPVLQIVWANSGQLTDTVEVPINTWTHVAMSKYGNSVRLFRNGNLVGTIADWANDHAHGTYCRLSIGCLMNSDYVTPSGGYFTGYMDNIRISRTTGFYRDGFTPERSPNGYQLSAYTIPTAADYSALMTATNPVVSSSKASGFLAMHNKSIWYWKDANSSSVASAYQQAFQVQVDILDKFPVTVTFVGQVDDNGTLTVNGDSASTAAFTFPLNTISHYQFNLLPGKNVLGLKLTNSVNNGVASPMGFFARVYRHDNSSIIVNEYDWKW